jgi:dihydroflavonol-4-reductase
MAIFDPGIREVVGQLGKKREYSHERAEALLGWSPRPIEETIVDCAQSLIDSGAVKAPAGG